MKAAAFIRQLARGAARTAEDPVVVLAQACRDDLSQRYAKVLVALADASQNDRVPDQRYQRILPPSDLLPPLP